MELLDGFDLETLVARHGPLPPARAVHLLVQACDALAEAHQAGLVHRDIKPANLFVCRHGLDNDFCKVVDFGLALPLYAAGDSRLTGDGAIAGTPAWIAPEAALGNGDLDRRADLYGLGCVAYFLLTGQPVFAHAHPLELVMAHVRDQPQPPSQRAGKPLPPVLEGAVLACLQKAPAERPADALALKALLLASGAGTWNQADAARWWQDPPSRALPAQPVAIDAPTEDSLDAPPAAAASAGPAAPPPVAAPPLANQPVAAMPAAQPHALPSGAALAPAKVVAPHVLSAERARVQAALRDGFAHSLLDLRQFEQRAELAAHANDVPALQALVADLPAPAQPQPARALAVPATHLRCIFSGVERRGAWQVPQCLTLSCVFGGAELDLTEAKLADGETVIELQCLFGGAVIYVPPGLPVVCDGTAIFGGFVDRAGQGEQPVDATRPHLRVSGFALFGGVEVRGPKRGRLEGGPRRGRLRDR